MKEKETATCPICGGELQVQGQALFKEHHKRLWEKECKKCGIDPSRDFIAFGEMFYHPATSGFYGRSQGPAKNKPSEIIKWEAENPIPYVDLIGFVVRLAKRLAGLGAEKGGAL